MQFLAEVCGGRGSRLAGILGVAGVLIRLFPRRRDRVLTSSCTRTGVPLSGGGRSVQTPYLAALNGALASLMHRLALRGAGRPPRPSSPRGRCLTAGRAQWRGLRRPAAGGGTHGARARGGTGQRHGPDIGTKPGRASAQLLAGAALPSLRPQLLHRLHHLPEV